MKWMYMRCFAISIAASCSSAAKPAPPSRQQTIVAPRAGSASDAGIVAAAPVAAIAGDEKFPRIFQWAERRQRNEKWLSRPSDDHCDPRNRHVPRKGEAECYPPSNVHLAAILVSAYPARDRTRAVFTLDRGEWASITSDYYVSLLDADDRPATKWVHPTRVDQQSCQIELPQRTEVSIAPGKTRVAIVERLTSDEQFPDGDPRSQP